MVATHSLLLLAILAGSSQQNGLRALAQAYQDSEHYVLPANIYDNLPPGLQTPVAAPTIAAPSPTTLAVTKVSGIVPSVPGPDDTMSLEILTPLLNSIYTPGTGLVVSWTNDEVSFPENWAPEQSILDMITKAPNFSNSSLLTKEDMTNLAKAKLIGLRRAQLLSVLKESSVRLHSLRLLSWPLIPPVTGDDGKASTNSHYISPSILSDPGLPILNFSQIGMLGGAGGQMTWMIPEDWEYEGEFEIRIPSPSGMNGSAAVSAGSAWGGAKSHGFWILRDLATRTSHPQYNIPPMDQQQRVMSGWRGGDSQGQKVLGVFFGIATVMLAFVLIGLGGMIGVYYHKWVAQVASSPESEPLTIDNNLPSYSPSSGLAKNLHQMQGVDPFVIATGDEDAHSPTDLKDLNVSDRAIGGIEAAAMSEKAMAGKDCRERYNPVDRSFVDLPLYEAWESTSTLAASNQDFHEKMHETKE
ncbi:hypothetical protein BGZ80_010088 [Entomortierella chlamydospora]|uniref:Uncharacterized protein n=1 Tax=Entomortierella chlamydospora TaxID=101097 RepID=A0A9P6T050_9FUNG|nr:hypothetical protein BGZ79_008365 [Entomortierella chlamydospora]KAG0015023.1 hypothetical protein BGZ80_010088 [Entomortierella chlamydospora]